MDNNFMIEITTKDGGIITLDTDELDVNIYQKCNGKSVRVLEMSGEEEYTEPGGHQLSLTAVCIDEEDVRDLRVGASLTGSLSVHSFTYGIGQ